MQEQPKFESTRLVAQHILQRLGEGGQPPEFGVERINVGNESYLRVLEQEYFDNQLRFGSSFKLVQGYFGGGKTHFLFCVRELAWRKGFVTAVVELSPSECPYDDAQRVYQAVARRVAAAPQSPLVPSNAGLGELLRELVDERLDQERARLTQEQCGDPRAESRRELAHWLNRSVGRSFCESPSFRQALVQLALAYLEGRRQDELLLEAWLLGEAVPMADLRPFGIYEQISRANGFTMLRSMVQMMVGLGFPGTALLFDEVDRNLSVGVKRGHVIGDNLRQVVDLCGRHQLPNTLFIYAVPPEFMRNVVPDYPALWQRLRSPVPLSVRSPQAVLIDLERLDLEPVELLTQLGARLVSVFEDARGIRMDLSLQTANARVLAEECANAFFEVNHRRLFVKAWVDFLYRQAADGEFPLGAQSARELIQVGHEALNPVHSADDFEDF